jgi:hypothetical protein
MERWYQAAFSKSLSPLSTRSPRPSSLTACDLRSAASLRHHKQQPCSRRPHGQAAVSERDVRSSLPSPLGYAAVSSSTGSGRLRPASDRLPESFSFRILSIDGGGIRGVIPALFLERLEARLVDALAAAPSEVAVRWQGSAARGSRTAFT